MEITADDGKNYNTEVYISSMDEFYKKYLEESNKN